ncbi:MAG: preprotein translocase subunit SecG [Acidobacteriia bacterium]|nr:preprotein translocase subunit SecG [Terriglobia bacterium]
MSTAPWSVEQALTWKGFALSSTLLPAEAEGQGSEHLVYTLLIILFIVVCLFLIMVVLLQQGKGADVAAAFGGASSQASFGPRGTATLMHKLTTGSFVLFVALCIGLSVLTARRGRSVTAGIKGKAAATSPAPAPAKPAGPATGQAPAPAAQPPAQGSSQSAPQAPAPPKK